MNSNLDYALAGARVSELQRHGHDGHDDGTMDRSRTGSGAAVRPPGGPAPGARPPSGSAPPRTFTGHK